MKNSTLIVARKDLLNTMKAADCRNTAGHDLALFDLNKNLKVLQFQSPQLNDALEYKPSVSSNSMLLVFMLCDPSDAPRPRIALTLWRRVPKEGVTIAGIPFIKTLIINIATALVNGPMHLSFGAPFPKNQQQIGYIEAGAIATLIDFFDQNYASPLSLVHQLEMAERCISLSVEALKITNNNISETKKIHSSDRQIMRDYHSRLKSRISGGQPAPSLPEAARKCSMGISKFQRMFQQTFKTNYKEFCVEEKLNYAFRLLFYEKRQVKYVASMTGYAGTGFFVQKFQKKFGITPKKLLQTTL